MKYLKLFFGGLYFFSVFSTLAIPDCRSEAAVLESSGDYGQLVLGFDPRTQLVTGYYENGTGFDERTQASRFTCIFYLSGKKEGDSYRVTTWFPGEKNFTKENVIDGVLRFSAPEPGNFKSVFLKLNGEHGGCWNVDPSLKEGESFYMDHPEIPHDWKEIRVVSAKKTHFFEKPEFRSRLKSYLVTGDVFRVSDRKSGWLFGSYHKWNTKWEKGNPKDAWVISKGWIPESDFFSTTPPR